MSTHPGGIDAKHTTRHYASGVQVLPSNAGELTRVLSNQKQFFYSLVAAGIEARLSPRDALHRAKDAIEWLRSQAVTNNLDSERQRIIKWFTCAGFRADGVTAGVTIAQRAIEACRLCQELFGEYRKAERAKAKRGDVQ